MKPDSMVHSERCEKFQRRPSPPCFLSQRSTSHNHLDSTANHPAISNDGSSKVIEKDSVQEATHIRKAELL